MNKKEIDWNELEKFARKVTEMTAKVSNMKKLISKKDGSKVRFYRWRKWSYHDNFITRNEHASGQSIIYYDKTPILSIVYLYSFDENADIELLKFIGNANIQSYDYFLKNTSKSQFTVKNKQFEFKIRRERYNEMGSLAFSNKVEIKKNGKTVYFGKDISGYLVKS